MALFEFELTPLTEVIPVSDNRLSWFWLTDGNYHMNLGQDQIFTSTDEIVEYWNAQYPEYKRSQKYVDYQVVRLYEDFLDILPNVLLPIPKDILALIDKPGNVNKWRVNIDEIYYDTDNEIIKDDCDEATEWWRQRHLSTMHLAYPPSIVMWLHENEITIRWDNHDYSDNGIQVWTSKTGEYKLSLPKFIQEVESFHNRFMATMKERVDVIVNNNPIPNVAIDIKRLVQEHAERELSLEQALKRSPCVESWDSVLSANQRLSSIIDQATKS